MSKVTFEQDIREAYDKARAEALDTAGQMVEAALRAAIKQTLGMEWDRFDHTWSYPRYTERTDVPVMDDMVRRVKDELVPPILEQVLAEPIRFTQKDLASLRKAFKEAVMSEAAMALDERARAVAGEIVDELRGFRFAPLAEEDD